MNKKILISVAVTLLAAIEIINSFQPTGYSFDVAASIDGHVFAVQGKVGMKIFKLDSNKSQLELISILRPPKGNYFRNLKVVGDHAFIAALPITEDAAEGGEVISVDISDPYHPKILDMGHVGTGMGLFIKDDLAFVAAGREGLHIYDIHDPSSLKLVGSCKTPGTAWDVWVSEDHAFVADHEKGMAIVDISRPTYPKYLGQTYWRGISYMFSLNEEYEKHLEVGPVKKELSDIFISNSFPLQDDATIAEENEMEWTIAENHEKRIRVKKEGENLNFYLIDPCAEIVRGEGGGLYVAAGLQGLIAIDVSDPSRPEIVTQYKPEKDAYCEGLAIRDGLLYLACGNDVDPSSNGLIIIDFSDPSHPELVGKCPFSGLVEGVALSEDRAVVANTQEGIALIDISDVKVPTLLYRAA